MIKAFQSFAFFFLIISMLLTSCVSSKKFRASEAHVDELQKEVIKSFNLIVAPTPDET